MGSADEFPSLLGCFREVEQGQIVRCNQAFFNQQCPVDEAFPVGAAHQDDGDVTRFPGLQQCQRFEEFVQRAESPGKDHQRPGAKEEVHFAQGEVAKLKAEVRRDVGVWLLFMRQCNVQPHRFGACIRRAAIGGFHNAGTTTGDDDVVALPVDLTG